MAKLNHLQDAEAFLIVGNALEIGGESIEGLSLFLVSASMCNKSLIQTSHSPLMNPQYTCIFQS